MDLGDADLWAAMHAAAEELRDVPLMVDEGLEAELQARTRRVIAARVELELARRDLKRIASP